MSCVINIIFFIIQSINIKNIIICVINILEFFNIIICVINIIIFLIIQSIHIKDIIIYVINIIIFIIIQSITIKKYYNLCYKYYWNYYYYYYLSHPTSRRPLEINPRELWKKNRFLASCSFRKNVLFKESPPSIRVTRNLNWSIEILWFGTGYVKGRILSPLKRSAWGRLHCWFCLKLLNIYSFMLWWFVYNIPDSGASEYSIANNSNSGVGKNS